MKTYKKISAGLLILALLATSGLFGFGAQASVDTWQKGMTILPQTTTDLASDNLKTALAQLANTHANYVTFIVSYYQSNIYSTDIQRGGNTPTDAALVSAIAEAHRLGLKVSVNLHVNPWDGNWRAHINPSDRDGWFSAYTTMLDHYAVLNEQNHVEQFVIGSELIDMTTATSNSSNTDYWVRLIAHIRAQYSGKLTYSSNWGGDWWTDEKDHIEFWDKLDSIGVSAYFNMNTWDNSADSLKEQWSLIYGSDIGPLQKKWNKPVLFTELGYKSSFQAHQQPWNGDWWGGPDQQEQANAYEALFAYWNTQPNMIGVQLWNWEIQPGAGGGNTTSYTPQNKLAENVMTRWFGGIGNTPQPATNATFTASGAPSTMSPQTNTSLNLKAQVQNTGTDINNIIVDLEVRNSMNQKVFQQSFDSQTFTQNQIRNYSIDWTPSVSGEYRFTIGVFNNNWSTAYLWNDNAATFYVGQGSTPSPTPTPTPTPSPSDTTTIDVWWPTQGGTITGVQPFKALVENRDVSQYSMYWQVDGDRLNAMGDSNVDWPHKEAFVDLSGWNWNAQGLYHINFVAKELGGGLINQRSIDIHTK